MNNKQVTVIDLGIGNLFSIVSALKYCGSEVTVTSESKIIEYSKEIGKLVGRLHKNGIMHGDLTTSNFILFKNTIKKHRFAKKERK